MNREELVRGGQGHDAPELWEVAGEMLRAIVMAALILMALLVYAWTQGGAA